MVFAFINLRLLDIIDILLVAFLLFTLYRLIRGSNTMKIFFGILAIYLLWKVVSALEMELLSEILGAFISVGVIALLVVFQPEIRRFLLLLGTPRFISKTPGRFLFFKINFNSNKHTDYSTLLETIDSFTKSKTGALFVIENRTDLEEYSDSGIRLNATLSKPLIESVFFKNSPLHDGAVIIRGNKLIAARCILPVSERQDIPGEAGLRHRAGIGISELSDAVVIIVSEENGKISFCKEGVLDFGIRIDTLKIKLDEHFGETE